MAENIFQPCKAVEVFHNAKMRIYRDGTFQTLVASRPVFKSKYFVPVEKTRRNLPGTYKTDKPRMDSIMRARRKIYDIARQNDFDYFVTWTLDKEMVNRYDAKEVYKKVRGFLTNKVQRFGLKYLIIPEHHKDGAIHMHGFISGDLQFTDSGRLTKRGQSVLNMPQWIYGFSTAVKLDDQKERAASYITKYITKEGKKIFGKYYLAGGKGLIKDTQDVLYDTDFTEFEGKEYSVPGAGLLLKYGN